MENNLINATTVTLHLEVKAFQEVLADLKRTSGEKLYLPPLEYIYIKRPKQIS